jgi:centrosomal protein CEP104
MTTRSFVLQAAELNYHSPQTRGWQSARFCEYLQEIGIAFVDGIVSVSQIQLLSHQSKIATRIELFVGTGETYFDATFTRLGYLSLDSNERSQYKARELKSVYIKAKGSFMKLIIHKCYINPLNLFNQVGLIAINVLGSTATPLHVPGSHDEAMAPLPKR